MSEPNPRAIAQAEGMLRKLRTGELSGFVAVATNQDDLSGIIMGGRINFTSTACLLELLRAKVLDYWAQITFQDDDGLPNLDVVPDDPDPTEDPYRGS